MFAASDLTRLLRGGSIKVLRPARLIYPVVLLVYGIVVAASVGFAARFLSTHINAAISTPSTEEIQAQLTTIDLAEFYVVTQKLGIKTPGGVGEEGSSE